MRILSELDRFHLAKDAAEWVYGEKAADFAKKMANTVAYHHDFIRENGYDIAEVEEWEWKPLR